MKKKISIPYEKHRYYLNPSCGKIDEYECVLLSYNSNDIQLIVEQFLDCYSPSNSQVKSITREAFDYSMNVIPYALRYNDGNEINSYFNRSLDLFFGWIQKLPFPFDTATRRIYLIRILLYLSQVFLNPSFKARINDFCNTIRLCFLCEDVALNDKVRYTLIKTLIIGCLDLKESLPEFRVMPQLLMELIVLYVTNEKAGWSDEIIPNLVPLFKYKEFILIVVESFSASYFRAITDNMKSTVLLDFMISIINSYFPPLEKHHAFETAINCWLRLKTKRSRAKGSEINDNNESIFLRPWPTELIKSLFFNWFSIDFECMPGQERGKKNSLPIFDLLRYGEPEKEPQVKKIAEQVIIKEFSSPETADKFWYIPVFSHYFLQNNYNFLLEDNHYELIFSFYEKFTKSKFSQDTEILTALLSLMNLIIELMLHLKRQDVIDRVLQLVSSFPNTDVKLNLLASFLSFEVDKPSQIWQRLFSSMKEPSFAIKSYLFYIYSAFFALLKDDNFFSAYQLKKDFWEIIQKSIRDASEKTRDLYYLSLYAYSLHSSVFLKNPNESSFYVRSSIQANNSFAYFLKNAILAGENCQGSMSVHQANDPSIIHFVTNRYIISIIDKNEIEVRSPLGINVFKVQWEKEPEFESLPFPTVNTNVKFDVSSSYIPQDDFGREILNIQKTIEKNTTSFKKYQKPKEKNNVFDSFHFLADLGFFTLNDAETARIVPLELVQQVAALDTIDAKPTFKVDLFQLFKDGNLNSVESEFLNKFISDVCSDVKNLTFSTEICTIQYVSACKLNSKERAKDSGLIIILNETNYCIKKSSSQLTDFDCILIVNLIPSSDYYFVEVFDKSGNIPLPFPSGLNTQLVHKERLRNLISLTIMLYYVNPYQQTRKDLAPNGPDRYSAKLKCRMEIIEQIYKLSSMAPESKAQMLTKFLKLMNYA